MLYAKMQGSEPFLLDQTQLTDESIYKIFEFQYLIFVLLVIALSDNSNKSYIEEIKKRKYTKEFHSFIKSCVSTRLDLRYKQRISI